MGFLLQFPVKQQGKEESRSLSIFNILIFQVRKLSPAGTTTTTTTTAAATPAATIAMTTATGSSKCFSIAYFVPTLL